MSSATKGVTKSKQRESRKSRTTDVSKATPPSSGKSSSAANGRTRSKVSPRRKPSRPSMAQSDSKELTMGENSEAIYPTNTQTGPASQNGSKAAMGATETQRSTAAYVFLRLAAETLEDIERVRIAAENRARALTHPEQNIGLPEDDPVVEAAQELAAKLQGIESDAEKAVKKVVRQTPLGPWVKQAIGVGEKQAGRLLGVIGNPRYRVDGETGEIHERTVGQLWSYCGYAVRDGVAPKRKRGEQGNWNPKARMRAYLIAESCMKSPTSPYRRLYEDAREKYADSKHEHSCAQCGAKGKPAQPGTDLRDGHKHARALRIVAKEVLRDMWIAADQWVSE